jgi:ABC-2 type transport system ATP-binding protein
VAAASQPPLIEIRGLTKRFGAFTAVDNVSFTVARGEVLGFLGPNGAGKSTTMRMLAGFMTPTAGTASICGHDVQTDSVAARKMLGFLPEGAPTYPDMTVVGFLRFCAAIRGYDGSELRDRVEPTDGLDPNQKHEVRILIAQMAPQKAIVISTHILEEVDAVCTRAMIIARGRVVADAAPGVLEKRAPSGKLDDVFREITQPKKAA